ncbi:ABC transporter substrate-binding protein [Bosea sp. BK604]|uniref:ABC transporter substrate-binding protein n=1 Tax=Bosea sp. BK604 TaxID=2512180 RepID=UPI001046D57D|nr:ABC transporter substrate-binding protein [Bosea sp. BK604]TCR67113.1 peptide/nickel transport system substrate-binding protein [Bosea sp. BK604]
MHRRDFLKAGAAAAMAGVSRPALAQSDSQRVLRFVPYTDLTILDPMWSTVDITRDYGYMVYDTLYGLDSEFQPQPQLAEGHLWEDDGRSCTITLRDGITFHDGEPIRARDCVASLKRWAQAAPMGATLMAFTNELTAIDDRRLRFKLKRPFPMLPAVLGQLSAPAPLIMPERVASVDTKTQITDTTGSGPFRFRKDEFKLGDIAVFEKFQGYKPTPVRATGPTAGPKQVFFDRVEWRRIPDPATAAAALQTRVVDWIGQPTTDTVELLTGHKEIDLPQLEAIPSMAMMRLNALHPPFNNKKIRQALLPAIEQSDFCMAVAGTDPKNFATGTGFFPPGTVLASEAGLEPLKGPRSMEKAKQLLKEAGYANEPVRLLGAADSQSATTPLAQVAGDVLTRLGLNMDVTLLDNAAVSQRRRSEEPVEKGGWSLSCWLFPGAWFINPGTNIMLRGNGRDAWFGWPTIPKLEQLRDAWLEAPSLDEQKRIARDMQIVGMDELPAIPLGAIYRQTALHKSLVDRVKVATMFWNIRRA